MFNKLLSSADTNLISFLDEWIKKHTPETPIEIEYIGYLLEYADDYIKGNKAKLIAKELNDNRADKTQKELIDRNIIRAEKMINDLMGYSPKGYKLQDMLIDMIENPTEYFAKVFEPKANLQDIRIFLEKCEFDEKAIKELLNYLKNPT